MKEEQIIRVGMVVRADQTGLGNQSQDWVRNLPIKKVLVAWGEGKKSDPSFYSQVEMRVCEYGIPTIEEIDWLLTDIDLVLTIETPYNWNLIKKAKDKGVKSIIAPNYEQLPEMIPAQPDLWLCYNLLNYQQVPFENKVYVPQPIDRTAFQFKKRKKARIFLFNNGNGGMHGRNCLKEFIEAIYLSTADVKFIINSQVQVDSINDSRVEVHLGDLPIAEIWKEGDVFVHLRKFGALSLPQNEAMSLGMPCLMVNRVPESIFMPNKLLVEPSDKYIFRCRKDTISIEAKVISPTEIAKKIDELANTDISEYSETMDKIADEWSWNNLRGNWIGIFVNLITGNPQKNYEHKISQASDSSQKEEL